MPVTTRIHAILTEAEQLAIVNALSFYNDWHATDLPHDKDSKEQYLLDRIDDKEREIADLRQELRDQVQLKEKGLTELAEMQSKRRLHEEKCQSEVSAAKTEVDLAKRTIKDLEAQVCARLRVGLFCHNLGLFCPIM